jgi:hypothetical protein
MFISSVAAMLGTAQGIAASEVPAQSPADKFRRDPPAVTSADQVLNVQDFEPLARVALPPAPPKCARHGRRSLEFNSLLVPDY